MSSNEPRNVAIAVHDRMELLDFAGPGEVFEAAGSFRVYTVSASTEPVTSQGFVRIIPQYTFEDCPAPRIIVLPGGASEALLANRPLIDWLRRTADGAEVILSVCTGSLVLAEAGLLDGLEATTHHSTIDKLRERAPRCRVRENVRFIDNGSIVTAAGVSAGIDGALHVVARLLGDAAARATARYMEYAPHP